MFKCFSAIVKLSLSQRCLDKFRGVACTPILQSGKRKHIDCFIEVVAVACCRLFHVMHKGGWFNAARQIRSIVASQASFNLNVNP